MILKPEGKCQFEDCDRPATCIAVGRNLFDGDGHPEVACYCNEHGGEIAEEGSPEHVEHCPNCGCFFGAG